MSLQNRYFLLVGGDGSAGGAVAGAGPLLAGGADVEGSPACGTDDAGAELPGAAEGADPAGAVAAGAALLAAAAACAARSSTEVASAGERVPMYASVKLVTKNNAANTAVNFENNVAVPRAPKTVPEAPEPNPAPASAPFPRCMSTRPMIISASNMCTDKMKPRSISISQCRAAAAAHI